jgi:VWFA-related protein
MPHITHASRATTCAALALAISAVLFAQQPPTTEQPPAFRGGVDLIQLVVSVLDDRRQPVRGLTAADFTILDEGVERPVRAFTPVEIPGTERPAAVAAWTRDIAPDVVTNQVGEQPGRLVVILMDRSIPHEAPTLTARRIATSIVDSLGPGDLAALVSTSGGDPQNFTSDRARLVRAINQRDWATGSDENPWTLDSALSDGRCLCGLCVFDTVTRVAEAVRDAPGRSKSLFFIGSGLVMQVGPRPPASDPGCDRLTRVGRQKMLDAIDLSNLTVHSIDPSGLESIGPHTRASTPGSAALPEGMHAQRRREAHQAETNETLATQGTLRVLPDLTGGRTVVNRNAPEQTVPEIFRESESYYVLGFETTPGARPGSPRSIEVKVTRRGVRVSTRRQYLPPAVATAPSASSSTASDDSAAPDGGLTGLLPDPTPPLTMALAAFASPEGPSGIVNVTVDAGGFVYDTESSIALDMSVTVVDQTGRPVASARQTSMISGPRPAASDGSAIQVPTQLALPPGDYEVRVAVTDVAKGTTASVFSQIVVPAFTSERLSLSDIVIEPGGLPSVSTAPPRAAAPTTHRSFQRTDSVQAFLEVYQGTTRTDALQPVSMRVRIINTQDHAVRDQSLVLEPSDFSVNRTTASRLTLPVQNLPPGDYLLKLDATMGERTAGRAVRFQVR